MKTNCKLNCWSLVSSVLFFTNLLSDWYVYQYEEIPFLPSSLIYLWLVLSIVGTVSSVIFLCLDCCYCIGDKLNDKPSDSDKRIYHSQWVFIVTLLEDLPLLILSLVTLNSIVSSDSIAGCAAIADLLFAFQVSSVASLVVSVFRLVKVLVLGCPTCDEPCMSQCYLCILYFIVSVLSCVVFIQSCHVIQMLE
jgi:hypothetical protein